jgi:hypothetical protein
MNEKKLCREIHPEIKVLDAAKGLVRYVASDETLDHYREVIRAEGWRFNYFRKNAPFVDSHDYDCIDRLLGKVTSYEVKQGKLIEEVQWAIDTDHPLAKLGFQLTEKEYLKAVSVGFVPTKHVCRGADEFAKAAEQLGLDTATAASCRCIYLQQEQLELSACIIGANPNALAKAWHAGDVSEEQMHVLGLDSDERVRFLDSAAKVWDTPQCDALMRSIIELELRRCHKFSSASESSTRTPESVDDSKSQAEAENRAKFLRDLNALVSRPA